MKQYRILSLDAKDIYNSEINNGEKVGYLLPEKKDENYYDRFNNMLDWSLDQEELEKRFKHRNLKFSFSDDYGNLFTLAIVNLTFKYSVKEGTKTILDTADLRKRYYEKGFKINGKEYVRYKRSSGSSRTGKCLFIQKEFLAHMKTWGECGLKNGKESLAAWESYKSLSLSAIKGKITIPLEGILFVEDMVCSCREEVISISGTENLSLTAEKKIEEIKNNIWDGESLLDESIFDNSEIFSSKHMLLLRNKFFKSCAFKTKIQKWFLDNNITKIEQLNGITLAKDVSQIVMITTPSSLKYLKFTDGKLSNNNISNWVKCVDPEFGVVKYDKKTRYFDGDMVMSSYQLLNTLQFNENEVRQLLMPTIQYLATIRNDIDLLRFHFQEAFVGEKEGNEANDNKDGLIRRSDVIFKFLNLNNDFSKTLLYKDFLDDVTDDFKKTIKTGNILLHGTNATIFGNGPELLKHAIGKFNENESALKPSQIRCSKFENGKELLCARSPHITMGNLLLAKNVLENEIWDYFDLSDNIVCVNAINENIQHRLNGCDYDSDAMLITDERTLVEKAKWNYSRFLVPVCDIKPEGFRENDNEAELDVRTSKNLIGEIVNFSQWLNSILWDKKSKNCPEKEIDVLYLDICKLAVLSGIEIDKAKRPYAVDSFRVLDELRKKYSKNDKKPKFFYLIDKETQKRFSKKNKDGVDGKTKKIAKSDYIIYNTTMDHIGAIVPTMCDFRKNKPKNFGYISLSSLFNKTPNITPKDSYYVDRAIDLIKDATSKIQSIRIQMEGKDSDEREIFYNKISSIREDLQHALSCTIKNGVILLAYIKKREKNKVTDWRLYYPLFEGNDQHLTDMFNDIIKRNKEPFPRITKDDSGDIQLYDAKFAKKY